VGRLGGVTHRAVILARGLGTRMRAADAGVALAPEQAAAADAGLKAMMPIGRPFLDYVLSALADAGFSEACLVIGPEHAAVREYFAATPERRVAVGFAVQECPLGTADAVLAAEAWAGSEPFLVLNGDNYYPASVFTLLADAGEPAIAAFSQRELLSEGNIPPDRIARFALLETDPRGYLRQIVEKPDAAAMAQFGADIRVSMNCWRFDASIFPICRDAPVSPRGELELPGAVQRGIDNGRLRIRVVPVDTGVLDLSSRGDVADVADRLRAVTVVP
jgi:glucose-1-phosphate thymidylyltransferase